MIELIRLAEEMQRRGKKEHHGMGEPDKEGFPVVRNYEQDLEINLGLHLKERRCKAFPGRWKAREAGERSSELSERPV